jgi:amino acid adenylation domain-containing protein
MAPHSVLHRGLIETAERLPDRPAVEEPGQGFLTYAELDQLSDRVRDRLIAMGVVPGDRIGFYLHKSADTVAALYGILKTGAAYVPVDPGAPPARNAYILSNCSVRVAITEETFASGLQTELTALGSQARLLSLPYVGRGEGLRRALDEADIRSNAPRAATVYPSADALAYILYTSGSTGKPKGVMLSHENAVSFVDWCSEVFEPQPEDRFSSHAPFHFDLSILDLHVPLKHGAAIVLIGEDAGKDPQGLARLIADERITCWYSAPSILALLAQHGGLETLALDALRLVLFAGEVFAVKHLRQLSRQVPHPRYFNLYGPTETNVCTFYEVVLPVPDERTVPYPIGKVCSHLEGRVVDEAGRPADASAEGELCIAGRGVMQGYWALPDQTSQGFITDPAGRRWYRTGDIVAKDDAGNYLYRGRRDRMVKRRGYRVELGEIEASLYRHPLVKEAAAVALPDAEGSLRIKAFLSCKETKRPSLIELKRFCSQNLPLYMLPDQFSWLDALPKTSTDKVDYQRLKQLP